MDVVTQTMERKIEKLRYILFPVLVLFVPIYYLCFLLSKFLRCLNQKKFSGVKIICVGNPTLGGAGKTTLVKKIVSELKQQNKKVAIITRGYKRKCKMDYILKIDTCYPKDHVEFIGDEPFMLFSELNVPISVSHNRKKAIQNVIDNYPDIKIIVSDDGYQNFTFYKDVNILLINLFELAEKKLFLFPLGNLREPLSSALKRADYVILNHSKSISLRVLEKFKKKIRKVKKDIKIMTSYYQIKRFVEIYSDKFLTLSEFRWLHNKIAICCGIGSAKSFVDLLKREGFEIKYKFFYPDHYWYKVNDIKKIKRNKGLPVVTTLKDAVKIKPLSERVKRSYIENFYFCDIEFKFNEGEELWKHLVSSL